MKANFEAYISNFIEEMCEARMNLKKLIVDAPERASCRKQKMDGGYHCCDICLANPKNHKIPGTCGSKLCVLKILSVGTDKYGMNLMNK